MRGAARTAAVSLAVVAATALAACGGEDGDTAGRSSTQNGTSAARTADYADGGTYTIASQTDLGTFDPYHSNLIALFMGLAYDSLLNTDEHGKIVSGLAGEWKADAREAEFRLEPAVTCSDGSPLTASQVKTALDYVKDPANAASFYGSLTPPVPFEVTANDERGIVRVKMDAPYGFILQTVGSIPIVCAAGMEDRDLLKRRSAGTGPFELTEVVAGDSYTFKKRAEYEWGPDGASTSAPGTPDEVVIRVVPDNGTAANLLINGELNATRVRGDQVQRLEDQGIPAVPHPQVTGELWFNQRDDRPAADLAVRRALLQGLDLDALTEVGIGDTGNRSTSVVTIEPKACDYDSVTDALPAFDPEAAAGELDAAGWTVGEGGMRSRNGEPLALDFHYVTFKGEDMAAVAELIAEQWKAIGVETKLVGDNATAMSDAMFSTGNWDVFLNGFGFSRPDSVTGWVAGPVPPKGQNFAGIANRRYERLAEEALVMTGEEACDRWLEAERTLLENLDVVPVYDDPTPTFLHDAELEYSSVGFAPTSMKLFK